MAEARPRVRVIAPARWAPDDVMKEFAVAAKAEGLEVEIDPQAHLHYHQLAGSDDKRAAALSTALSDKDVDIIWCVRGGYGSTRALPLLTKKPVSHPKLLIGYSDMTALQLGCALPDVTHIHGPMPIDITRSGGLERLAKTARMAKALLANGHLPSQRFELSSGQAGTVTAPLAIGNLCVLTNLLGTPFEPQWDGVILCLEDISEYYYALDRHFVHLAQSRAGSGIAGIVLGDFTEMEDNEVPWGEDVIAMAKRHFPDVPVATGLPIGHGVQNVPLIQGAAATLTVSSEDAMLLIKRYELKDGSAGS